MRPPITYALIPLLVGLPICGVGNLSFEKFASCCLIFALLYWSVNKAKKRSLVYRKIMGIFFGIVLVYVCIHGQSTRNAEIIEKEHSNTWKMMPPRELNLTLKITRRNDLKIQNEIKFQVYEGYIIDAPEVRMDLVNKKVTWILKKRNGFQEMLKGDTVYLCGIIKHRRLNDSQNDEKRRN